MSAYSSKIIHTGPVGSATSIKLVNNVVFAAHVQVAGAAVELAAKLGLGTDELLSALSVCSANSFAIAALRSVGHMRTFAAAAAPYLRKDVAVADTAAADTGLDLGLLGHIVRGGPFELTTTWPGGIP